MTAPTRTPGTRRGSEELSIANIRHCEEAVVETLLVETKPTKQSPLNYEVGSSFGLATTPYDLSVRKEPLMNGMHVRFINALILILFCILGITGLYGLVWHFPALLFDLHRIAGWGLI